VDPRTDVWSLASVLYCALAGVAPHQEVKTVGRLFVAIGASPAPPLRERAPWVSPELAEVVHAALAIDLAQRTPSAAAMLEAIQKLAPGGFALREEMLAGIPPGERGASPAAGRVVVAVNGLGSSIADDPTVSHGTGEVLASGSRPGEAVATVAG